MKANSLRFLNGNMLKILAAIFMLIDHAGLMFFPNDMSFRIVGRLAFPIFAFMISEGARYTKNKLKYFLSIAGLALVCQVVFYIASKSLYMSILVSFTLSIITIYALHYFKKCLFSKECKLWKKILSGVIFVLTVLTVTVLNDVFDIDYGFFGCMAPVLASLFDFREIDAPEFVKRTDNLFIRLLPFGIGLVFLANASKSNIQIYSLFSLLLLLCYSEQRGKAKMKYFFYIFYPLHLVLLTAIQVVIYILRLKA